MIKEFIDQWDKNKGILRATLVDSHPESYEDLVNRVITIISEGLNEYRIPDSKRIHKIDDGDYQGTLIFVIGATGYQPNDYWYVKVGYGSCSGCDTLEGIRQYDDNPPKEEQIEEYMTLALHIVQGLKLMGDEDNND